MEIKKKLFEWMSEQIYSVFVRIRKYIEVILRAILTKSDENEFVGSIGRSLILWRSEYFEAPQSNSQGSQS